jgi:prophage regulatory protein
LNDDQQRRDFLFTKYKEELLRLVSKNKVDLIDESRNTCTRLTPRVYFTKREAINYLENKGLLDRAFATGFSWRDQILEPEVAGLLKSDQNLCYGLPQELIAMGLRSYRETLTLRRMEVLLSQLQLAQLPLKKVEELHVLEESSAERNAPIPASEPVAVTEPVSGEVENKSNFLANVVPVIQVLSPPAVEKIIKFSSSEQAVVSGNDDVKSMKKSSVVESEMISVSERESAVKRLMGINEVMERLGVSRATIYNYISQNSTSYNPDFPLPIKLNSENRWYESELDAFMETLSLSKKKIKK